MAYTASRHSFEYCPAKAVIYLNVTMLQVFSIISIISDVSVNCWCLTIEERVALVTVRVSSFIN